MATDVDELTLTEGAKKMAVIPDHDSNVTFTLASPTTNTTIYIRNLRPPRLWQASNSDGHKCYMDCFVYFLIVEVSFWPVPESEEVCANSSQPISPPR